MSLHVHCNKPKSSNKFTIRLTFYLRENPPPPVVTEAVLKLGPCRGLCRSLRPDRLVCHRLYQTLFLANIWMKWVLSRPRLFVWLMDWLMVDSIVLVQSDLLQEANRKQKGETEREGMELSCLLCLLKDRTKQETLNTLMMLQWLDYSYHKLIW